MRANLIPVGVKQLNRLRKECLLERKVVLLSLLIQRELLGLCCDGETPLSQSTQRAGNDPDELCLLLLLFICIVNDSIVAFESHLDHLEDLEVAKLLYALELQGGLHTFADDSAQASCATCSEWIRISDHLLA